MDVSGILVVCRPEHLAETTRRIEEFDWADVHCEDADGRLIATIEAVDADQSVARLKQLQGLPHVVVAELATYYVGDQPS